MFFFFVSRRLVFRSKANTADSTAINMTFIDIAGFDVYMSNDQNCPSATHEALAPTLNATYSRLDLAFSSAGDSSSGTSLPFIVGLRSVGDGVCTYSIVAWETDSRAGKNVPCQLTK